MPEEKELVTDVAKLQAMLEERNLKLEKSRQERAEIQAENERYRKAEQERAEKEKQTQTQKEQADLEKQQKYQEALAATNKSWEEKTSTERRAAMKEILPGKIAASLSKTAILPQAVADVTEILENRISIDPTTYRPYVKGPDGKPLVDPKTLVPVDVDTYVANFVAERSHIKGDGMQSSTGHKSGSKDSVSKGKYTLDDANKSRKVMADWYAEDPEGFDRAIAASERAKYLALKAKAKGKVI